MYAWMLGCISFDSYIKPQLCDSRSISKVSCISFDSYIKPQPSELWENLVNVVYLLTPTSNHNACSAEFIHLSVVYLLTPTSNHNLYPETLYASLLYIF